MKSNILRQNLFDGDSYKAQFARIAYRLLMGRDWVCHADIMAEFLGITSAKDLTCNLSNCEGYGELKKSFGDIKQAIVEKTGDGCFEEEGNNRNKRYRYIGENDDPLADMKNAKVVNDLRQYWKFCQDSAGFFPESWLDYFFSGCRDLLDIKTKKRKGQQVIQASVDRALTNIEYLPMLYEEIANKQVMEIDYQPYGENVETLIFHPHYLKEFNGRWFLLGHVEDHDPRHGYVIALDRITTRPREKYGVEYIPAPDGFYQVYFENIIGVSHWKGEIAHDICVRAYGLKMFNLIKTKRLHPSQEIILEYGNHENGDYGDFVVHVEINNEFIGQILQMGEELEIISPEPIRAIFKKRVIGLAERYK